MFGEKSSWASNPYVKGLVKIPGFTPKSWKHGLEISRKWLPLILLQKAEGNKTAPRGLREARTLGFRNQLHLLVWFLERSKCSSDLTVRTSWRSHWGEWTVSKMTNLDLRVYLGNSEKLSIKDDCQELQPESHMLPQLPGTLSQAVPRWQPIWSEAPNSFSPDGLRAGLPFTEVANPLGRTEEVTTSSWRKWSEKAALRLTWIWESNLGVHRLK